MTDREFYKETFSKIHASELDIQEVIKMAKTNNVSKKFMGRKMFGIAACIGCLLSACLVANAAICDSTVTDETEAKEYYYNIALNDGVLENKEVDDVYVYCEDADGNMVYEKLVDISKDSTVYVQVTDKNGEMSFQTVEAE